MLRIDLNRAAVVVVAISLLGFGPMANAADVPTQAEVLLGMRRAAEFFRHAVGHQGAYVWRYSADLKRREGEGKAKLTTAWVQPPGVPSVGEAFLDAYEVTHDSFYLEAAHEAAMGLVRGQLRSGGWDYRIEFAPDDRRRYDYRAGKQSGSQGRNVSTLDDDTTQAALRFLMRLDRQLQFRDSTVHESVTYALQKLLAVQYPNGAWPQRFSTTAVDDEFPIVRAEFPESWSRNFPDRDYRGMFTLNDNTLVDMIGTMWSAWEIYSEKRFRQSAEGGGQFLLLAQLPEPQPAWAQQYDHHMHPVWARKFEPPSVTGGESQAALDVLMDLYVWTEKEEFLKPIPAALDYLNRSRLPDGRLARFYELRTNRPLYFTRQYELTYDAGDLPTHYSFIVTSRLGKLERRYSKLLRGQDDSASPLSPSVTATKVRELIEAMDDRGAWLTKGSLKTWSAARDTEVIESSTFILNLRLLGNYVAQMAADQASQQ